MTRQLPAGTCFGHAIRSVRNNIAYAFRISWPWYAILVAAGLGAGYLADNISGGNPEANPGAIVPLYLLVGLLNMLGFASVAVNWHRYILLDEVPHGSELLRLDDKTWRYFGNVLLIMLILFAVAFLIMLPVALLAFLTQAGALSIIFFLVALPFVAIISYRLSVKLPAIALGRRDFLMRDAWAATRDNKLPIFLVALFQFFILIAVVFVLALLVFGLITASPMLGIIVGTIFQVVVGWVLAIFGITLLTSLYGFFVEKRDF